MACGADADAAIGAAARRSWPTSARAAATLPAPAPDGPVIVTSASFGGAVSRRCSATITVSAAVGRAMAAICSEIRDALWRCALIVEGPIDRGGGGALRA